MTDGGGRSIWFVPILVAIITAAGAVAVAMIGQDDGSSADGNGGGSVTVDPDDGAPDIAGHYHLDPDNPRVIVIKNVGDDEFSIEEREPAPWPFYGTVEWRDSGQFDGTATFDSGVKIRVTLVPMPGGKLLTSFDFMNEDRIDEHLLVPVE